MKILVIQLKMIGDVLASTILCNNLRKIYPQAEIHYLIYPFTKPVVENNPNIDEIVLFKEEFRSNKITLMKFLGEVKKVNYDLVIDAYGKLESNLVVAASGAKIKIGMHKYYTHFIYSQTVPECIKSKTNAGLAIENRMALLQSLPKIMDPDNKPKLFLTENEIENGRKILSKNGIKEIDKVIMISVLGSGNIKTYPFSFMAKILDFIVEKTNAILLFNYVPSQKKEATAIYDLCKFETKSKIKIDVVPGNIREFLSLTYHCCALIGNEGGAVNMAKALNIPTFTIFSPWVEKEAWSSFEDGKKNIAVHLQEFKPELYIKKSTKELKNKSIDLYNSFIPDLFESILEDYLKNNC